VSDILSTGNRLPIVKYEAFTYLFACEQRPINSPCFTNRVHVLLIGSSPYFTNESIPCFTTCLYIMGLTAQNITIHVHKHGRHPAGVCMGGGAIPPLVLGKGR
jgi:hypothetical protein